MKKNIERCQEIIAFLIRTKSYQGHSSNGVIMSICTPERIVLAISELSNIIGRMEIYEQKKEEENFNYMLKFFNKTCDKYSVDLFEFDDWMVAENEMDNSLDNKN